LNAYLDTSFLASLYVLDRHSEQAVRLLPPGASLMLTPLAELELENAIQLRLFRRELTASQARAAQAALRQDVVGGVYASRAMPPAAYEKAKQLARKHTARLGTRSLDILHVAAAMTLGAGTLLTFDENQRKLAAGEGVSCIPKLR
jgi:predicted nucleic acid-binding protein